ncbi:MAG: hypothetical protein ACQETR_14940 [Thermodesulfobacteriota bacterium]
MANTKSGKRPCSICRRWFLPDVRQRGRQKTCSAECRKELHRRQCERWNKKNKSYFKAIYLNKKLERSPPSSPGGRLDLPCDVIVEEIGKRHLIILQYLIEQVVRHLRRSSASFP